MLYDIFGWTWTSVCTTWLWKSQYGRWGPLSYDLQTSTLFHFQMLKPAQLQDVIVRWLSIKMEFYIGIKTQCKLRWEKIIMYQNVIVAKSKTFQSWVSASSRFSHSSCIQCTVYSLITTQNHLHIKETQYKFDWTHYIWDILQYSIKLI